MIAVLGVLLFAPVAFADNWGLGLKLGYGENDPKSLKALNGPGTELDENGAYFGVEAMYEWNLDDLNKIGARVGVDSYGENEIKGAGAKIVEETYAFPFTVYYKRDNGVQNWSWLGGVGFTIVNTKIDETSWLVTGDEHKTKIFPHIVVGGEYRFTEVFALGLEARYNIGAKVKKDGAVFSDRSGFGAALTGRFYF